MSVVMQLKNVLHIDMDLGYMVNAARSRWHNHSHHSHSAYA